jgi:hypothetical protein
MWQRQRYWGKRMFSFLNPGRWAMYLALIAALALAYIAWERHIRADERAKVVAEYNVKIDAQKAEAQYQLDTETAKVMLLNLQLRAFKDTQENEDVVNSKAIALLADKLHTRVLIDPNAARCGQGSGGSQGTVAPNPSAGTADNPQTSGVLSVPLTGLLLSITREADAVNLAYISCRSTLINERSIATE